MPKKANKLIHETSPYLLQHAYNPVQWFPWSEEALQKAKDEDKPILISIGYAACHWCHVMEKESFEDAATAELMNRYFINIKIDREERPDLDHIYMDAVQAMTGSGGWPLNVFLTPDAKPFYGGTYFPPQRMYNRPSWKEVLQSINRSFTEKRNAIIEQADKLTAHLQKANDIVALQTKSDNEFTSVQYATAYQNIIQQADKTLGGFGAAPKFPQSFALLFLLRFHHITKNEEALQQALLSLNKMIEGGIYDQLGGGFARYATDAAWLIPHFEKMLYDNALLLMTICEAYQLSGEKQYLDVIQDTMDFIEREMLSDEVKGFYAALDADSEGVEGKFYTWSFEEVQALLGEEADLFCEHFGITENGNMPGEAVNVLHIKKSIGQLAEEKNKPVEEIQSIIAAGKRKLWKAREKRIRPGLDDKIILGWNALMNAACSKVYAVTGNEKYKNLAIENMQFLLRGFMNQQTKTLSHTWKNGQAKYPAYLDDYAYLIDALLLLAEMTADTQWLHKAEALTEYVLGHFEEKETGFFFYTPFGQKDVIIRKKEIYDGALPSGNAVMAANLWKLGLLTDKAAWRQQAINMLQSLVDVIIKFPLSFGHWASILLEISEGTHEIAVIGPEMEAFIKEILHIYIPHRVLMAALQPDNNYPLLAYKQPLVETAIYLCRNYTCRQPVFSVGELMLLINNAQN
ncbi:MAG TPA: thioredoxin domain-containing protein [Chitinophagaceae bacterium]|nr:thioredoxin domain-containing protein [Chitinophagaceae bacterium]MCB0741135.1 thioredoxin domain-containing protein [Chitinophagaceae bacterium]HQU55858.1 thioredoxin domain-containing protein [Chitinophagaceae bacterium]